MDNKTSDDGKSKPSQNSNDHWGKMNDQFDNFFAGSQPEPAEHHKRNEEN